MNCDYRGCLAEGQVGLCPAAEPLVEGEDSTWLNDAEALADGAGGLPCTECVVPGEEAISVANQSRQMVLEMPEGD